MKPTTHVVSCPQGTYWTIAVILLVGLAPAVLCAADNTLVTGRAIKQPPLGTQFDVGSMPMNLILSPDGKYAVSTDSGFRQALWSVDVASGQGVSSIKFELGGNNPRRNGLYYGLVFDPNLAGDGTYTLYAAQGGANSVAVVTLNATDGQLSLARRILAAQPDPNKFFAGDFPCGLALDRRNYLYVTNNTVEAFASFRGSPFRIERGSLAIYDRATEKEIGRYEFESDALGLCNYPFAVAALADGSKTYVTSQRDAAVYVLNTTNPAAITLIGTLAMGSHPIGLLFNKEQTRLYVANAQSDTVSVIDTTQDQVIDTILLRLPGTTGLPGASPCNLALSPDGTRLYVALSHMNAIGVIDLTTRQLIGYVPVGWYPTGVIVTPDNARLLVTNAKGTDLRNPNPGFKEYTKEVDPTQYILNIIEGNVQTLALPSGGELDALTADVLRYNRLPTVAADPNTPLPNPLYSISRAAGKIKHVIYIVKENRTYDQMLSDLPRGNNDPNLLLFGREVTPNQHALAERFVHLDNFYVCAEASGDGWPWSTRSFANESVSRDLPYNYSGRGRQYDWEGQNNGYLVGGHPARDVDGNLLSVVFPEGCPPITDVADGPNGGIWDVVKRAGLTYRNYGFHLTFGQTVQGVGVLAPDNYPASAGLQPEGHDLAGISDYDFRRYDMAYADSDGPSSFGCPYRLPTYGKYKMPSRFSEFRREFDLMLQQDPNGSTVPNFLMVRFPTDHTDGTRGGRPTPRAMCADNDYAVGQFVELISNSPIWPHTAIFVIEDDAQAGPDHVDAHRSICFIASPYIRRATFSSNFYNTASVLKTMELLLNIPPMSQYDGLADSIDVFDTQPSNIEPFKAIVPASNIICEINPAYPEGLLDPASYLSLVCEAMNLELPDSAVPALLNEAIWRSVKGSWSPMPEPRRSTTIETEDEDHD